MAEGENKGWKMQFSIPLSKYVSEYCQAPKLANGLPENTKFQLTIEQKANGSAPVLMLKSQMVLPEGTNAPVGDNPVTKAFLAADEAAITSVKARLETMHQINLPDVAPSWSPKRIEYTYPNIDITSAKDRLKTLLEDLGFQDIIPPTAAVAVNDMRSKEQAKLSAEIKAALEAANAPPLDETQMAAVVGVITQKLQAQRAPHI